MVREGLSEEAAIILRPGLKGINQIYKNLARQYKSLYTGTETESASMCFKNRKKEQHDYAQPARGSMV